VSTQEPLAVATIFDGKENVGEKMLVEATGQTKFQFSSIELSNAVHADLLATFESGKSGARSYALNEERVDVFLELVQPGISLIIFGGGFDARPVSELAKSLGWNVSVTDECVAHIAPIFFPTADKLSLCQRDFIDRDFNITPYTACVLMSHNYEYDRDVLRKIIKTETPYIGILGPRKRFDKMLDEFAKEGITLSSEAMHRIHSPIGLDIGAETPDEIAVSIIAEVQGKFANRSGGYLKYRNGPIHHRDTKSDQVFKQVFLSNEEYKASVKGV
jgi:xanthine dehydrogenase accessory factor